VTTCLLLLPALAASGPDSPANAAYDQVVGTLLRDWGAPCGALAVAREGRLVVARGYGPAEPDGRGAVRPTTLFRIASISKPITALAIHKLVAQGRLRLDDKVCDRLADRLPPSGPADARWRAITVRHLLRHSGGWDSAASFDPMFRPAEIAAATRTPAPASAEAIVRHMFGQPLQFDPGTRTAYSNFGYCVLGRIIERVSGRRYEDYVREAVLVPAGAGAMRLGRTAGLARAPGEGWYAMPPAAALVRSVFPDEPGLVASPYGGFHLEAMDAHGGWLASPVDLVRCALRYDGRAQPPDLLDVAALLAPPLLPLPQAPGAFQGDGWVVRPVGADANWWHGGSLPGTSSILVRSHHGFVWAAVANFRPADRSLWQALDAAMWEALAKVEAWPAEEVVVGDGSRR